MYEIVTPVWKKEPVNFPRPFVHTFYKTMFMKLYELDEKEAEVYIGKNGAVTYGCDFLWPLVAEVWKGHKNHVTQFYDIRTSEEAGQAAPEYAILKKAGIKNISPVNIRGMNSMALLLGLQMAELEVKDGDCAIMLLAELEHDFSAQGENIACAFALYPCHNIGSREGIWITDYRIHLTVNEMRDAVECFSGTIIFSEVELDSIPAACSYTFCNKHGLTNPFRYLYEESGESNSADILSVHISRNQYGLIYYHVVEKGRE